MKAVAFPEVFLVYLISTSRSTMGRKVTKLIHSKGEKEERTTNTMTTPLL